MSQSRHRRRSHRHTLTVGDTVLLLPFLSASILVWYRLPPGIFSTLAFIVIAQFGMCAMFYRVYLNRYSKRLREAKRQNIIRMDGSESSKRAGLEDTALAKLKLDLVGNFVFVLVIVNILAMCAHYLIFGLLDTEEELVGLEGRWGIMLAAGFLICGLGIALIARTFRYSVAGYESGLKERAEQYAQRDISRLQKDFEIAEASSVS